MFSRCNIYYVDQSVSIQCVFYLRLRCRWTPGDRAGGPGGRGHFCPVNCELQHATRTHTPATHTRSPCLKKEKKARFQTLLPTFHNKSTPQSERQAHRQHHVTLSGLFGRRVFDISPDWTSDPDLDKVWRTTQTEAKSGHNNLSRNRQFLKTLYLQLQTQ